MLDRVSSQTLYTSVANSHLAQIQVTRDTLLEDRVSLSQIQDHLHLSPWCPYCQQNADQVSLSASGRELSKKTGTEQSQENPLEAGQRSPEIYSNLRKLDPQEQRVVEELRQRDQEVRTHEQAHLLAAGPYALGGPLFTYHIGPDGQRYAVEGKVPIDVSPVPGDPQATIQKAATIRRAALAPAHPSGADLAIAAKATTMMAQAQQEIMKSTRENYGMPSGEVPSSPFAPTRGDNPIQDSISPAFPITIALASYQQAARSTSVFHLTA